MDLKLFFKFVYLGKGLFNPPSRSLLSIFYPQHMQDVLGVREQVVELANKFCPSVIISAKALDQFRYVFGVNLGGGPGASISYATT